MKLSLIIFAWLLAVSGSFHFLMSYSVKEGRVGKVSKDWPAASKIPFEQDFQLVMFMHPGCSCSNASLSELSRLLARENELAAHIVFMKTKKLDPLFQNNELLKKAKLLPRTQISFDEDGVEAKSFGALTSGQTYLYNRKLGLLFSGGLTVARGHEGRSTGQEAIELILKKKPARKFASVFGCDIFGSLWETSKK